MQWAVKERKCLAIHGRARRAWVQVYLRNDFQALHNIWDHLMLQATVFSLSVLPARSSLAFREHFKNSDIASAHTAVDVILQGHTNANILHSYLSFSQLHHLQH